MCTVTTVYTNKVLFWSVEAYIGSLRFVFILVKTAHRIPMVTAKMCSDTYPIVIKMGVCFQTIVMTVSVFL